MADKNVKRKGVARHRKRIHKLAVLTSGGDAPGMNAAIRSVVRTGIHFGAEVYGVERGYTGLLESQLRRFDLGGVANIIQRGGTILRSDRCLPFKRKRVRAQAVQNLREFGIEGLICIGGDGTFTGAELLWREHAFPVAGVPGTIDNDLYGTDVTIGFDSAINTALDAIDRIRDTASSHDRLFIIEVMGRNSGYIAMDVGIGGVADAVLVPEAPMTAAAVARQIRKGLQRGKNSSIIVVAEGQRSGKSLELAKTLREKHGFPSQVCILGHVQRGGAPSARDRKVASVFGALAVRELLAGYTNFMTGIDGWTPQLVPLREAICKKKAMHTDLIELAKVLAT